MHARTSVAITCVCVLEGGEVWGLSHFILGVINTCEIFKVKVYKHTKKHASHGMNLRFLFLDFLAIPIIEYTRV